MPEFTSVNRGAAGAASSEQVPAITDAASDQTRTQTRGSGKGKRPAPTNSADRADYAQDEEPERKKRAPPTQADSDKMQVHVTALLKVIADHGVEIPTGIGRDNSVIVKVIQNGVPGPLSNQNMLWDDDQNYFVYFAAESAWKHGKTAAYLGRSEQSVRLKYMKMKKAKQSAERETEVIQNGSPHPPSSVTDSSGSSGMPVVPDSSDLPQGGPISVERGRQSWEALRAMSPTRSRHHQMSLQELPRWRAFVPNLPPIRPLPGVEQTGTENLSRQPALMEPTTKTSLDMQEDTAKDSEPSSHVTRGCGLDVLAEAAATAASHAERLASRREGFPNDILSYIADVGESDNEERNAD